MLRSAAGFFDQIVLTQFTSNPRASSLDDLDALARQCFPTDAISRIESPMDAWHAAWSQTQADDLLCVAGSFFIDAELLPTVRNATKERTSRQNLDD
jgi:dihydrofolate synthase/folylpolyglutamate synthase